MREINAAWQVLRSPAGRAAYDDELRSAAGAAVAAVPPSRAGPSDSGSTGARPPSFGDQLVDPARDESDLAPGGSRGCWGRWAPVLIVLGLVLAGSVVALIVWATRQPPAGDQPELRTNRYQVGSCVGVQPGQVVVILPCDGPNSGRIASTTDYPRPCPAGTATVPIVDEQLSLCLTSP